MQGKRAFDPIAVANKLISLRNASRNREHQAQRQIGDVVVEHPRRVADFDATLHGANDIHAVIAHTANRNELQGGKQRHQFFVDDCVATSHHGAYSLQSAGVGDVVAVMHDIGLLQIRHQVGGQVGDPQNIYHGALLVTYPRINTAQSGALAGVV